MYVAIGIGDLISTWNMYGLGCVLTVGFVHLSAKEAMWLLDLFVYWYVH